MQVEIPNSAEVLTSLRKAVVAMRRYIVFALQDDVVVIEGLMSAIEETIEKQVDPPVIMCTCGHPKSEHIKSDMYSIGGCSNTSTMKIRPHICSCLEFRESARNK